MAGMNDAITARTEKKFVKKNGLGSFQAEPFKITTKTLFFLNMLITDNDQVSCIKHVLHHLHAVCILLGHWVMGRVVRA